MYLGGSAFLGCLPYWVGSAFLGVGGSALLGGGGALTFWGVCLSGGSAFLGGCLPPKADPLPPSACWDRSHGRPFPQVGQTHACENLTFALFATRAVIICSPESNLRKEI